MIKHTPGPWFLLHEEDEGDTWIIGVGHDDGSARPYPLFAFFEERDDDTMAADAHLVAAAPDLLAALEKLLLEAIHYRDSDTGKSFLNGAIESAGAAIAKARGEVGS